MKSLTKLNKVFCGIFIFIIIISIFSIYMMNYTEKNIGNKEKIIVKVQGKIVKDLPLNKDNKSKIYKFNFNNNYGYIETKNGKVRMLEMDRKICPKEVCSDTGWISKKYQIIVCMPNKITVNIDSNKQDTLDAISS